jgi:hypothetical protein
MDISSLPTTVFIVGVTEVPAEDKRKLSSDIPQLINILPAPTINGLVNILKKKTTAKSWVLIRGYEQRDWVPIISELIRTLKERNIQVVGQTPSGNFFQFE